MMDLDRVTECRKGAYRNAAPSANAIMKEITDVENANFLLGVDSVSFEADRSWARLARETQDDTAVMIHRSARCDRVANDGTTKGRRISCGERR